MPHEGRRRPDKVGEHYTVGRKLGRGSFGSIYLAVNSETGEELAVKVEKKQMKHSMLQHEAAVVKMLVGGVGVPNVHHYDMEGDCHVMVMDLLGPSLEDLFCMCDRRFSVKTVAMIADQVLTRLEFVHGRHYVHRDIKPENFLIGRGSNANLIHLIDYGLAKLYCDPETLQHIDYKANKSLTGTARYASVHAHMGAEQGRRDDLEAVGYMLLYFLLGRLPWQGFHGASKEEKYQRIMESKQSTPIETLCAGQHEAFATYLRYCRELGFQSKPDYDYLRRLFAELLPKREDPSEPAVFDWWLPPRDQAAVPPGMSHTTDGKGQDIRTCHSSITKGATLGATDVAEPGSCAPSSQQPRVPRKGILGICSSLCSRGTGTRAAANDQNRR